MKRWDGLRFCVSALGQDNLFMQQCLVPNRRPGRFRAATRPRRCFALACSSGCYISNRRRARVARRSPDTFATLFVSLSRRFKGFASASYWTVCATWVRNRQQAEGSQESAGEHRIARKPSETHLLTMQCHLSEGCDRSTRLSPSQSGLMPNAKNRFAATSALSLVTCVLAVVSYLLLSCFVGSLAG